MIDTLRAFVSRLPWGLIAAVVVSSIVLSLAALVVAALALPADYFVTEERPRPRNKVLAALAWVGMNLAGLVLVLLGVVLSFPGIPGQGVLTIIVGLLLMDFPGKRALERRLLDNPKVLRVLNAIRARFGRPMLLAPLKG